MSFPYSCTKAPARFFVAVVLVVSSLCAGCGKSADELYTEGKSLLLGDGTFDEGVKTLLRFEKKHPEDPRAPEVVLAIATAYQSRKNYGEAERTFARLIEKYPGTPEAYKGMFLLGYMYYEDMKDTEKAKTTLDRFIEMYPDSELTVSARVLVENIGLPMEEWSVVRKIREEKR